MVYEYEKVMNSWSVLSPILSHPMNTDDLKRLIDFSDYLIDRIGGDEKHPLAGLLDIVGDLIEKYESQTLPEPEGSPTDNLKYLMEEHGLKDQDMPEIGTPVVVSEILSGKRKLEKHQIPLLAERFRCNPSVFLSDRSSETRS